MRKLLAVAGIILLFKNGSAVEYYCSVDTAGDVGRYISVDYTYVSYYDSTNGDLKILGVGKIDTTGDVGKYTSIRTYYKSLTPDSFWVSYYDVTNGNLKCTFGKKWSDTFIIYTVDTTGDVGLYTSLDLDASDYPHISYYDATNGDLKYATWNGTNWNIEPVDTAGNVGMYSSIAVDTTTDSVYISYYDATNGDLKFAIWDGTNWNIQKVDTTGDVGRAACFRMQTFREISYYDATNGNLKLAVFQKGAWGISTLDTTGDVGMFNSINRSKWSTGIPCLCYYDKTKGNLNAQGHGDIDTAGDVGMYCVCFTGPECIEIYYYDATNGDLKYFITGGAVEESNPVGPLATLSAFPNPFSTFTAIQFADLKIANSKIKIYDISGKLLEYHSVNSTNSKNSVTLGKNLKSGIYFLRVNNSSPLKFIKL